MDTDARRRAEVLRLRKRIAWMKKIMRDTLPVLAHAEHPMVYDLQACIRRAIRGR